MFQKPGWEVWRVWGCLWLVPTQVTHRTVQLVSQLCFYEILLNYCNKEDNIKEQLLSPLVKESLEPSLTNWSALPISKAHINGNHGDTC